MIAVADTGPGLAQDTLDRIFDKFYRAPAAPAGGTGLGLSIVKGFIEAQGGRVEAANRPAGGAVFTLRLPLSRIAARHPGRKPMSDTSTLKPSALIIDDELQIRRLLRVNLEANGYRVLEAATGQEGITQAAQWRPDVVILDLGLPDMDGVTVLKRLREWSRVPVVVLSVRDREEDKVAALDNGADDYVTKPFSTGELLARLRVAQRHAQPGAESACSAPASSRWT